MSSRSRPDWLWLQVDDVGAQSKIFDRTTATTTSRPTRFAGMSTTALIATPPTFQ